jgi:hypothetical protein
MAKRTQILLIDDIDGSEAKDSIEFGINGQLWSIDLSEAHLKELMDGLSKFIDAGTALGKYHVGPGRKGAISTARRVPAGVNRDRNAAIRAWCETQPDITISSRGRIPDWVVAKFEAAHAG